MLLRFLPLAAVLLALSACTEKPKPPDPLPERVPGDGTISDLTPAATAGTAFRSPFDATLSPDGKIAYFTALDDDGPAVFKADAPATGAPVKLAAGDPLAAPFGIDISSDGKTLIVADSGATVATDDKGELLSLDVAGGTPAVVPGASGYAPRGVVVLAQNGQDQIFFTGIDPADRLPGVFTLPLAGGTVKVVAKDAPFADPSGLVVAENGDVYALDAADAAKGTASVIKVSGGVVSVLLPDLAVGYPAGIALSENQDTLLISALNAEKGTDVVVRMVLSTGAVEQISSGIDQFSEPAGLHRAKGVDAYIWADSKANGGGTVYVINKQQ